MSGNRIIDTHAHLCDSAFDRDRAAVIAKARCQGVAGIIAVGENMADSVMNLKLSNIHHEILPAAGLDPTCLDVEEAEKIIAFISKHRSKLVAIGEVGLDFWKVREEKERAIQREIFIQFIELSGELGLPLNVHSRSAGRHVVELLLKHNVTRVQLHAFDGKAATAMPALEAGYFFSIPPSIVRSSQKRKLVKRLPLSSILLETDSPVLGPSGEERNEPANASLVAEAIADIKGIELNEVLSQVKRNTDLLYGSTEVYQEFAY